MDDPTTPLPHGPSRRRLLGWTAALPFAALVPVRALADAPRPGSRELQGQWDLCDLAAAPATRRLALPADDGPPRDHARGPDGRLWFTDWDSGRIGWRASERGAVRATYAMPLGRRSGPAALAFDGAGRLYIGEMIANRITRFDPAAGRFDASWELPLPRMRIRRLAVDSDGYVWCADARKGKLARLS